MKTNGVDLVNQKESVVVTYGRAYDFSKVFDAYAALVAALGAAYDGRSWVKPTKWIKAKALRIPPDRDLLRSVWERMESGYQITDESLVHVIGPLTLKASLLGTVSLIYGLRTAALYQTTNTRRVGRVPDHCGGMDVLAVEPNPEIFVYGGDKSDGTMLGVSHEDTAKVRACVEETLASHGLKIDVADGDEDGIAVIAFPFARFRAASGFGELRVRCVVQGSIDPDGASV